MAATAPGSRRRSWKALLRWHFARPRRSRPNWPPSGARTGRSRAAEAGSFFLSESHPFPTCFACGPKRSEGDGLRLFAGKVAGRDVFATAWTPAAEFGDEAVDPLFVWAALDCPSSAPAMSGKTIVLASLAAALRRPVAAGEPHVIGSWRIGAEGRKHWNGVVLWDAEGGVCAVGRALWIELRESK